jgi:hypothetical protein
LSACPQCGEERDYGQEYCLECGLRMPGPGVLDRGDDPARGWIRRTLIGLVVAVAGVAAAVAATGGTTNDTTLVTALGGFATSPSTETLSGSAADDQTGVVEWPTGQNGWTIALATLPQSGGRQAAVAKARSARKAGLPAVGLLDTSQYASLHPGYWLVFTGNYTSEAEATSALQAARSFTRTAGVRRIVP